MLRILLVAAALAASASLLSACNTTAGAGKDLSATGQAISDTAAKATP